MHLFSQNGGAAPIQRAIMHGDDQIGVTIMEIVEKLDAGNIFLKIVLIETPIKHQEIILKS